MRFWEFGVFFINEGQPSYSVPNGGEQVQSILIQGQDAMHLPPRIYALFPERLMVELASLCLPCRASEIHLRQDRRVVISMGEENLFLDTVLRGEELKAIVAALCDGSFYAHADRLGEGYLSCEGVRIGLCGQVATEGGRICSLAEISSLCIRLPHRIRLDMSFLRPLLASFSVPRGLLVFSPPGGGKTTFLRECARELASGKNPLRVAVVDSREELGYSLDSRELNIDLLSGYPKSKGIEIAVRALGAQVIICDELGEAEETNAILAMRGGGVPLITSAHASDLAGLLATRSVAGLHAADVFGAYVRVQRGEDPVIFRKESLYDPT